MTLGVLVLEDGTVFDGQAFGAMGRAFGEVVFNTSMTGYQEVLTDPSYAGQIVTMTYPLIGNYGLNDQDDQSRRPWVQGLIVREACAEPSNWRCQETLEEYLARHGIIGLAGLDTRALTRRLRTYGTMRGLITTEPEEVAEPKKLVQEVKATPFGGPSLVRRVTTSQPYHLAGPGPRVVVVDLGVKLNILKELQGYDLDVVVVPSFYSAAEILAYSPKGVLFSNGPGNPKDVPEAIATARELAYSGLPLFGICLGHQILGLALGGDTYKLKFGHRGSNHPVKDLLIGRVYITAQNHGYALAQESLPPETEITHLNLNDGTVEGIRHRELPIHGVQYHPEGGPGPEENRYLFQEFVSRLQG
ncbi:MAG: glutamine-hydrolyzing carbamoyl-phosphate synthase small subunit [Clostridia bacterium]|jgi:carbamoyl-phosphate synthase small subunit|nr:glutamine-hydrolyzing carbamoyl-phosphate synthase small subunit [Clostridia bacterium]MDH7573778.1 glutamine-hydrolyzing carbamoyl-phosphate synthase small subunit [Clostridia bacterium]